MSNQFTIYQGTIDGTAGSLITVLDAVLVAGQGWTHPIPTAGNIASYKQPAGCGFGFVLNDNGPNVTSTTKEAWATGWETVLGVGAPVGTGTGQFPTPAQLLTSGHVVVRKSVATGAATRVWRAYADDRTVYLFITTGDGTGFGMMALRFGDFFSMVGQSDAFKCMIAGRSLENSATGGSGTDSTDSISSMGVSAANFLGHYAARGFGGSGTSVQLVNGGALGLTAGASVSITPMTGLIIGQNPEDNTYYISPLWVYELATPTVRGRYRGMYHIAHTAATFADGQRIPGSGYLSGKTLEIVKGGPNSGYWAVEVSATLETNV